MKKAQLKIWAKIRVPRVKVGPAAVVELAIDWPLGEPPTITLTTSGPPTATLEGLSITEPRTCRENRSYVAKGQRKTK